jgi:Flp pilus assembly protein TadD
VLHRLGILAIQRGSNEKAIELLERAIALKPDFNDALSDLGWRFISSADG